MSRGISGPKGRAREVYNAVVDLLGSHGLRDYELHHANHHYQLHVAIGEKVRKITLPVSPRDKDAVKIKLADVRRLLRQEGVVA